MNNIIITILLTILLIANAVLFAVMVYFSKSKKDTASRVGFGFMEIVTFANMTVVLWRIFG